MVAHAMLEHRGLALDVKAIRSFRWLGAKIGAERRITWDSDYDLA